MRDDIEEIKRHFDVVSEETRSQIAAVAEGVDGLSGRMDSLAAKVEQNDRKLEAFRLEVRKEFDETRAMIRLSYGELERRGGRASRTARAQPVRVNAPLGIAAHQPDTGHK